MHTPPNLVVMPRDEVLRAINGEMSLEDFRTLAVHWLDAIVAPTTPAHTPAVRAVQRVKSAPAEEEQPAREPVPEELVTWLQQQAAERFPESPVPGETAIAELWHAAQGNRDFISDLLDTAEQYHRGTKGPVQVLSRFLIHSARSTFPDKVREQADAWRRRKARDNGSIVEDLMRATDAKLKTLPPKQGTSSRLMERVRAAKGEPTGTAR